MKGVGDFHGMKPGPRERLRAVPALLLREHTIPLGEGEIVIGRGSSARISILASLVSRRHARLTCDDGNVVIEDLGSKNGVFINGVRLDTRARLEEGDTLLIGTTQLSFFYGTPDEHSVLDQAVFDDQGNLVPEPAPVDDWGAQTELSISPHIDEELHYDREEITVQGSKPPTPRLNSALMERTPMPTQPPLQASDLPPPMSGQLLRPTPPRPEPRRAPAPIGPTRTSPPARVPAPPRPLTGGFAPVSADPLLAALGVVDRMLGRGDVDAASRTLAGNVAKRIDATRAGQPLSVEVLEAVSKRCLALLDLSGDPTWFDAVVDLHTLARSPMAHSIVDQLEPFAKVVPGQSHARLEAYQDVVRDLLADVDIDELHACERILLLGS